MTASEYSAPAELFAGGSTSFRRRQPLVYRRFPTLAEAVRYVVEELPSSTTRLYIETDLKAYSGPDIREAYDSPGYPLERRA